jgi:hypothetical protein
MPVIRTYNCNDCNQLFEVVLESGNDGDPPCPYCDKVLDWKPGMFAIKTNKSRALDITQQIVEEDYGLTNLKDNLREGDVAAMTPPKTAVDREQDDALQRDLRDLAANPDRLSPAARNFFGGGAGGPFQGQNLSVQSVIQNAKGSVPADRNPMALLAEAGKKGELPLNYKLLTDQGQQITVRR